jgi:hypothetical protein
MYTFASLASTLAVSGMLLTGPAPAQVQCSSRDAHSPMRAISVTTTGTAIGKDMSVMLWHGTAPDSRRVPRRSVPMALGASVSAAAAPAHIMVASDE